MIVVPAKFLLDKDDLRKAVALYMQATRQIEVTEEEVKLTSRGATVETSSLPTPPPSTSQKRPKRPKQLNIRTGHKWALPSDAQLENGFPVFPVMGRGRKTCKQCKRIVGARVPTCICGWNFLKKRMGPPPKPRVPKANDEALGRAINKIFNTNSHGIDITELTNKLLRAGVVVNDTPALERHLTKLEKKRVLVFSKEAKKWRRAG